MPDSSHAHATPARLNPVRFAASVLQLGLLLHAIHIFGLERSLGLVAITPVVFFGFCAHAWLPVRLKLPCFLALSVTALLVVLGPLPGALVVAISLALFGLCHLPIGFAPRGVLLALAGGVLAALLTRAIETTWAVAVVPVVAAMFMFRSIIYLYDLRAEEKTGLPRASIWMRLSYFFLLPNVCFLLFPVVDYRTFQRSYYDDDVHRIHQRGIRWILRGIVHLLVYRGVYAYLTPSVAEIQDLAGVVLFGVSSYLLYLRISGHFHLIVGLLHLFGFHLPETNHNYLFASSFTDTWRRINLYWTDFMKKIVYFPVFVRLRKRGMLRAMVAATTATFLATWILHAYQWFWLHGSLPVATDGLFWGVAGAFALVNMAWEAKVGGGKVLQAGRPSLGLALRRSVQALGMFCLISAVWSLWCSPSPERWFEILSQARHAPGAQVRWLVGGVAALLLVATIAQRVAWTALGQRVITRGGGWAVTAAGALGLALLGHAPVQAALGSSVVAALAPITQDTLNERDRARLTASYYDRLIDREGFGGRVWEETRLDPDDPEVFLESAVAAQADGPLRWELPPSSQETFQDVVVATNSFGMRDREYTVEKPADTFRIAILGACYEMGTGVSNDEVWEALAEERLNRELAPVTGRAYEILNFSVAGYDMLQLVTVVREKVPPFEPDLVIVSNHVRSSVDFILKRTPDEAEWPSGLAEMVAATRLERGVMWEARLEDWAFGAIAAACSEFGATPALLNVPLLESLRGLVPPEIQVRIDDQAERARELGFEYLDIGGAFAGESYESVAIAEMQRSPSAAGHRLLSEEFFDVLLAKPGGLGAR